MDDEATDPPAEPLEGSIAPLPTVALGDALQVSPPPDREKASPAPAREDAEAAERSKDTTHLGLGAADGGALTSQSSGTLLGIAAMARPDLVAPESLPPSLQLHPVPGEPLPRFDDNPLIAAFPPQPRRSPPVFEGFVPLGSPTRAFNENGPLLLSEPVLDTPRPHPVEVGPKARQWRAPSRIAGVAAGCFGLAASLAVASHALTSAPALEGSASPVATRAPAVATEVASLAPSGPQSAPAAPDEKNAGASVAAAPEAPDDPRAVAPEARGAEPAEPRTTPGALPTSAIPVGADAGAPIEDVAAPEDTPAASAPEASNVAAVADPTSQPRLEASEQALAPHQLEQLFALETRSETYRCAASPAADQARERTSSPQALWREWRRAQQSGDVDGAYADLCELGRISPSDPRVPTELAALALRWGDARGAQEAARSGLSLAPEDAALKQLLGDALALVGELEQSRRLWLEPFGADGANEVEAIDYYDQRGATALERSDFARARTFFRRALVISRGGMRSSAGLSDALAGLGETRAAVAWAERAALAAPRDAKLQLAYGDTLYRAGDMASARRAWSAAGQIRPSPAIRRRLARGHL